MRRIPRPQRAIDPSLPGTALLRHQIPPPSCRRTAAPHSLLRTTSASFSTTPAFSAVANANQDKKKHQAFVRRWQKRLLGDSEPIGAHVDPYDPTSPVRIAPEEQGEELEELEGGEDVNMEGIYLQESDGTRLKHVGGPKWTEQLEEGELAKEYEKLTMRTYTPLSQRMAKQMEDLTGSLYTLRDENLMMAQQFEDTTNKPYTSWSFGPASPVRNLIRIRHSFYRAVVEIYALKQARQNMDVSAAANRGIYTPPGWINHVKLQKTSNGDFALAFPERGSMDALLKSMQSVPEYSPQQPAPEAEEPLEEEELELVAEEPVPEMNPNTPAYMRAAVVKQDPDKKPFDFMSNRPVPRAPPKPPVEPAVETVAQEPVVAKQSVRTKPVEPVVETVVPGQEPIVIEEVVDTSPVEPASIEEVEAAVQTTPPTADPSRLIDLERAIKTSERKVASLQSKTRDAITALASEEITRVEVSKTKAKAKASTEADAEAKWRHIPLTDIDTKFALTKRLSQLTGLYISDPNLTSANTLGDLYYQFCAAAKPKAKNLFTQLHVVGQRQAQLAKKQLSEQQKALGTLPTSRPNISTLLKLNNVEIHRKRPNATQERQKTGVQKLIAEEVRARKLSRSQLDQLTTITRAGKRSLLKEGKRNLEGTKVAPNYGAPVSPTAAHILKERTERKKRELFDSESVDPELGMSLVEIEDMLRERQRLVK